MQKHQATQENSRAPERPVSVIIVSYYTGPLLWRALHSALQQDGVGDIIVVDNGNWPEALANLIDMAALEPRLKVVTGHGNVGFAAACNLGARAAHGQYLFILNPDAVLPTGAVKALLAEGLTNGGAGPWMVGGRLMNPDGTEQPGARRATLTPWTALVEMLRLDRLAPKHPYFRRFNNHQELCPKQTIPIPVISGACMLMPATDYAAIGGMDERYFLHVEDVDFCLRFREAGGKVLFCPSVDILHSKSSSRANRLRIERRKAQSLTRYFGRHFSTQYPMGFVPLVNGLVWVGFAGRVVKTVLARTVSLIGLNRRRGIAGVGRAIRVGRRGGER